MSLPVVAIIGRPNVGKSSLFNALAGRMISIVEPTAGVTRDRVSAIVEYNDRYFELIDTGGYGIVDSDQLKEHIENSTMLILTIVTSILFFITNLLKASFFCFHPNKKKRAHIPTGNCEVNPIRLHFPPPFRGVMQLTLLHS